MTDGAAALILMSEAEAKARGIKPLGYIKDYVSIGLDPHRMGLGPVYATSKLLNLTEQDLEDFDLIEINEAFAAQVLSVVSAMASDAFAQKELGRTSALGTIDLERLNVNGGALAVGHPLGASGTRMVLTLLNELHRRGMELWTRDSLRRWRPRAGDGSGGSRMTDILTLDIDSEGIAIITLDLKGEALNTLSSRVLKELEGAIDTVSNRVDVRALILISGKEGSFIAGADLREISDSFSNPQNVEGLIDRGHALLNRIAGLPIPTIAAINGVCLGGGTELALAFTYRICSDNAKTVIALPEVT